MYTTEGIFGTVVSVGALTAWHGARNVMNLATLEYLEAPELVEEWGVPIGPVEGRTCGTSQSLQALPG